MQRLRCIRQLAFTYLVYPGAEHSRFSHVLGVMSLAGKAYDALAAKDPELLEADPRCLERRLVRVAALLHDIGHAPFSHSAEDLFEAGMDHEKMTERLLQIEEMEQIFQRWGAGLTPAMVIRIFSDPEGPKERLLSQIISGELDVDKMDYLLRDSLFCGVRYGSYDLARLLDTSVPLKDPLTGQWGIGVDEGGVHALEALIMARYYMFTQVYFNVTGKALELHFNEWLSEASIQWSADPELFLTHDDISIFTAMRASDSLHAKAVVQRDHYPLAFETNEHLTAAERADFESMIPALQERFGTQHLLVSKSSKDPHRMAKSRVLVRRFNGDLEPMEEVSHFIRHLARIERYRIYTSPDIRSKVAQILRRQFG